MDLVELKLIFLLSTIKHYSYARLHGKTVTARYDVDTRTVSVYVPTLANPLVIFCLNPALDIVSMQVHSDSRGWLTDTLDIPCFFGISLEGADADTFADLVDRMFAAMLQPLYLMENAVEYHHLTGYKVEDKTVLSLTKLLTDLGIDVDNVMLNTENEFTRETLLSVFNHLKENGNV